MRNYNLTVLFVFFISSLGFSQQIQWPLVDGNAQGKIWGVWGEIRGPENTDNTSTVHNQRFHQGIDITGAGTFAENYEVHSINVGVASYSQDGSSTFWGKNSKTFIGNVSYIHTKPISSIENAVPESLTFYVGDHISDMIEIGTIHVHLQSATNYLSQHLFPYVDTHPPEINTTVFADGYKIYRSGLQRISTTATQQSLVLEETTLFNNVIVLMCMVKLI
jgi:hypothetical protein